VSWCLKSFTTVLFGGRVENLIEGPRRLCYPDRAKGARHKIGEDQCFPARPRARGIARHVDPLVVDDELNIGGRAYDRSRNI
jgi:hypothetical protein